MTTVNAPATWASSREKRPDLELGFRVPFAQGHGDPAEGGVPAGGHRHPGTGTGPHHRAHERAGGQVAQCGTGPDRRGVLGRGGGLAGEDGLVALKCDGVQQPQVSRYHVAELDAYHVAGYQIHDVDAALAPVAHDDRLVADPVVQGGAGPFGAVLVGESEPNRHREDAEYDRRVGALPE